MLQPMECPPPPEALTDLFYFIEGAPSQKTLARFEREDSIKNNLFFNPKYDGAIAGQTIIVIDDVLTTGSTMRRAFELLHEQGAKLVIGLALAKTVSILEDEKSCQKCSRPMKLRINNTTKIRFWGCSGYHTNECDYTEQIEEKPCSKCGRPMVKRMNRKKGTYFLGCVGFNQSPACHNIENL